MADINKDWNLDSVIDTYRRAYAANGDSAAAVLWPRGRQELRFEALTAHMRPEQFSVLDFGCGLAHLKDYLDTRFREFEYHGVDIVEEFVSAAQLKHPGTKFSRIRSFREVAGQFDYVAISGTFNVMYGSDPLAHRAAVREALEHLFSRTRIALAVNFMTDRVDYTQQHAYHENIGQLHDFACSKLSPRLVLDQSYMPYEFTLTVFRDADIVRPENIYRAP